LLCGKDRKLSLILNFLVWLNEVNKTQSQANNEKQAKLTQAEPDNINGGEKYRTLWEFVKAYVELFK